MRLLNTTYWIIFKQYLQGLFKLHISKAKGVVVKGTKISSVLVRHLGERACRHVQ